jgi:exodeoxyribonuclease VII large subunit
MWCDTPMEDEARGSSPETAYKVSEVSRLLNDYLSRLNRIWIEGQIVSIKPYGRTAYIAFRDIDAEFSLKVVMPTDMITPEIVDGARVVIFAQVEWWAKKGELNLRVHSIRSVGLGELLARIEMLRRTLDAEGLFDPSRKKPLPFLPRKVGLITGRDTDAFKDVVINARRRWPHIAFEVREIALQLPNTPLLAASALAELNADKDVDVIVIARGGGSFEDLLPWSDEGLLRAVAQSVKPVVSAIGHEADRPLLDEVADVRASTPTDAARKIVPSLEEEEAQVDRLTSRLRDHRSRWFASQEQWLTNARQTLRASSPKALIHTRIAELAHTQSQLRSTVAMRITRENGSLTTATARLAALSPFAVLNRGYAVATDGKGAVIRDSAQVAVGDAVTITLHSGSITTQATEIHTKEEK